ncbi:MAG TPA: hypothetical protein VEJ21_03455, partial [Acidimicrobiales bacterium]|nr:hypothetical protein [Acidimicrobiales bacterium]
ECVAVPAGAADSPKELCAKHLEWIPATVPGTAAGALRDAGVDYEHRDFDAEDWWFRCRLPARGPADADGRWLLGLGGLATLADVWLGDQHLLHSENMFVSHQVDLDELTGHDELVIRCAALLPALAARRARPRWKTYLVDDRNLRWFRTSLMGRMPGWAATPAPVGPWRPVRLRRLCGPQVSWRQVTATRQGDDGMVTVSVGMSGRPAPQSALLRVGEARGPLSAGAEHGGAVLRGSLLVPGAEPWWPATHGEQPLYDMALEVDGTELPLGRVGFRTLELRREDGAFALEVNGVPVFCRGATWMPVDPVSMAPEPAQVRAVLELVAGADMNMVRLPATGVYQDATFWDVCDELGLLVWQDCMFAFADPPDAAAFVAQVEAELSGVFTGLGGRPSPAVVCGGQEVEEQAAMLGIGRQAWTAPLFESVIPTLAERWLPGVPYVTNNPTGGAVPFRMDSGVSHFFGVGGYLRPLESLRQAGVRFASECLAFATPPEPATVDEVFGGPQQALDDQRWRAGVHHDAGRSWDLEDMQDHYMAEVFGLDPFLLRWRDPERYLELARATVAYLMTSVLTEWRRAGSTCAGGLVLALRDLRLGPGWGVLDALGRPKAPYHTLKPVLAPVAVLLTDEGLNGLRIHLVNDTSAAVDGVVRLRLYVRGELCVEEGSLGVSVPPRRGIEIEASDLFDGFRDITAAYGFGPAAWDVVVAALVDEGGTSMSEAFYLPGGPARPVEPDVGLEAAARRGAGGTWEVSVGTRRFAQWVRLEVPGFRAADSWFHLAPGERRVVALHGGGPAGGPAPAGPTTPAGVVRALNSASPARLQLP